MEQQILLASDVPGLGTAGQTVQLALTPADVHVTEEMSNYLAGYKEFEYRAGEVSKVIPVPHSFDTYRTFGSDNAFLRVAVKGSGQGAVPEIDVGSSTAEFAANKRYVGSFVPKETEIEARWDVEQLALERCSRALDLDLEVDVWTLVTTTTNWASSSYYETLTSTTKWNGGASSDPIKNIQDRIEASLQPVTEISMNLTVANVMLRHDKVKDYISMHVGDGGASRMMAQLNNSEGHRRDFFLPAIGWVKVVESKYTDTTGTAPGYCLGNHVALTCSPPGVPTNGDKIATTYTYRREGDAGMGYSIRKVDLGARGLLGGTLVVVAVADKPVMTGNNCGGLIVNAVA